MAWWLAIPAVAGALLGLILPKGGAYSSGGYDPPEHDTPDDDCPSAYYVAEHNGRAYDCDESYPCCNDGSPDMRYAENYCHADDD